MISVTLCNLSSKVITTWFHLRQSKYIHWDYPGLLTEVKWSLCIYKGWTIFNNIFRKNNVNENGHRVLQ